MLFYKQYTTIFYEEKMPQTFKLNNRYIIYHMIYDSHPITECTDMPLSMVHCLSTGVPKPCNIGCAFLLVTYKYCTFSYALTAGHTSGHKHKYKSVALRHIQLQGCLG